MKKVVFEMRSKTACKGKIAIIRGEKSVVALPRKPFFTRWQVF